MASFGAHKTHLIVTIIGIAFCVTSISGLYLIDVPLNDFQIVSITDPNGAPLVGTYYPGSQSGGVLLLEGFGSDQTALRNIASEFRSLGLHIFSFDFSGHGQSIGSLGFDNAATDRLANQVLSAKEEFKDLSGLSDSEIVMFGHSMGARVAVQASVMDPNPVAGLILFGAQINLDTNVQSEFFTGVSDADLEWVQSLNSTNPALDILMVIGTLDDILPPSSAQLLMEKLNEGASTTYERELIQIPGLVHNYEVYSGDAITPAKLFLSEKLNLVLIDMPTIPISFLRSLFWLVGIAGIFLTLIFGDMILKDKEILDDTPNPSVEITNEPRFLKWKLILWLAAIPFFLMFAILFFMIPIGIPVFNIVYVGFIGSYGLALLLLYRRGSIRGTEGKLSININSGLNSLDFKRVSIAVFASALLTLWCAFYARTGIYFVFPLNERVVWLVIFSILTTFGFYVGQLEYKISMRSQNRERLLLWNLLIGLLPFFLLSILWYAIGSLSGMIGSLQGILIITVVTLAGNPIQRLGKSITYTALFQSFLLQLLILPTGVLFAFW